MIILVLCLLILCCAATYWSETDTFEDPNYYYAFKKLGNGLLIVNGKFKNIDYNIIKTVDSLNECFEMCIVTHASTCVSVSYDASSGACLVYSYDSDDSDDIKVWSGHLFLDYETFGRIDETKPKTEEIRKQEQLKRPTFNYINYVLENRWPTDLGNILMEVVVTVVSFLLLTCTEAQNQIQALNEGSDQVPWSFFENKISRNIGDNMKRLRPEINLSCIRRSMDIYLYITPYVRHYMVC